MLEAALSEENEGNGGLTYLRPRSQQAGSSELDFEVTPSAEE